MLDVDRQTFSCGPLRVSLDANDPQLSARIAGALLLYGVRWPEPLHHVQLTAIRSRATLVGISGSYLRCARMLVDRTPSGLHAKSESGASARGTLGAAESRWVISIPNAPFSAPLEADIEDLVGLALTTGWRRCGFIPFHGAAVARRNRCAIICAHSGGGKSTLTAALVRRGWQTLGDDKLLLSVELGRPRARGLVSTFNLHPQTRAWFPEVGDLESLEKYSAWTEKRRVPVERVWSEAVVDSAAPTHFVVLQRSEAHAGIRVRPMPANDVLPSMLEHLVMPSDSTLARATLAAVATIASQLRGLRATIGRHAYRDTACLQALEDAL